MLAAYAQGRAAGDDHLKLRAGFEQVDDQRRGGDDLLEVVEDQQNLLVTESFGQPCEWGAGPASGRSSV